MTMFLLAFALFVAPEAPGAAPASEGAKEKQICKRQLQPGTLAYFKRVCGTKEFWEKERHEAKALLNNKIDGCRQETNDGPAPCY